MQCICIHILLHRTKGPWVDTGTHMPLIESPKGTTIYGSSYDNIWIPRNRETISTEWTGNAGVMLVDHEFFPGTKTLPYTSDEAKASRKQCNKELSDHRPVWATFNNVDDDGGDAAFHLPAMTLALHAHDHI